MEIQFAQRHEQRRIAAAAGSMPEAEDVVRGSLVNILGKLGRLSKSAYFIALTRLVGAESFGLYTLGWSLTEFVSRFGLMGLDRGVVRFVARFQGEGDPDKAQGIIGHALWLGLLGSGLAGAAVWILSPWAAESLFHKPSLTPILRILAFAIPFMVGSSILLASLRAARIMKYDIYVKSLAEPLFLLTAAGALWTLGAGMPGLAFAYLIAAAGGCGLALRFFARIYPPAACFPDSGRPGIRASLVKFSAPILIDDVLYSLMSRLGFFILAAHLPAVSVGIYAVTYETAGVVKNVRQAVDPIFSPVASTLVVDRDRERLSDLFAAVTRWILTLELMFLLGVGLWGHTILSAFGPGFQAGFWSLLVLSSGYAVNGALGAAETLLLAAGRSGLNLSSTVVLVVTHLGLNLALVPAYGIVGAALAAAVSLTLSSLLRILQAAWILKIHPFRPSLLKPLAAAACAYLGGMGASQLPTPWSALSILSIPLYLLLLGSLGVEEEDRQVWNRLRARLSFAPPRTRLRVAEIPVPRAAGKRKGTE